NGAPLPQTQATDTILVLDRPVSSASANPDKPYTMLGPKPCPFALFDKKGVTGATNSTGGVLAQYAATNNPNWNNTNVDNIQFPNLDSKSPLSCSAVLPVFKSSS